MSPHVVYLQSGRRKPVLLRHPFGFRDVQGEIPKGWCIRCGAEVFKSGSTLCCRCQREEKEK